jgi:phospholipase/carboxylesterase
MSKLLVADPPFVDDPHAGQGIVQSGEPLATARLAVILVHGRGRTPEHILEIVGKLDAPSVAYLAPAAADNSWYPKSFLVPIVENEPRLSSSLRALEHLIDDIVRRGIPPHRIVLLGFSQGACVVLEFAARNPRRYAAVVGLSGAIFGSAGTDLRYNGSFEGTPVFLGCSDVDQYIPLAKVHESAEVFRELGAEVDERIYIGMGHTIARDEIDAIRQLLDAR